MKLLHINSSVLGAGPASRALTIMNKRLLLPLLILGVATASAAPATYTFDRDHTHSSFEVDHFAGLSSWRGTFKKTSGKVTYDAATKAGAIDVLIDTASIDLAHDKLNEHVSSPEMLDVDKFPTAEFKSQFTDSSIHAPKTIVGELTLLGITNPVTLSIKSFKCFDHPMLKNEVCGADPSGDFNRGEFGVHYGERYGFKQDVLLRIQVEGIRLNQLPAPILSISRDSDGPVPS
jgi:polyisoprenoid-binding protein YceI